MISKNLKNSQPVSMHVIICQMHNNRSTKSVWHLDSTHRWVECKCIASGDVDVHSRCIMWFKCSGNNKWITTYELFKEAISKFITPLQVRGDKGSENRLIANHMLRITYYKGHIGGRSTHNTRIERFGREHNVNAMIRFRDEFQKKVCLSMLLDGGF